MPDGLNVEVQLSSAVGRLRIASLPFADVLVLLASSAGSLQLAEPRSPPG